VIAWQARKHPFVEKLEKTIVDDGLSPRCHGELVVVMSQKKLSSCLQNEGFKQATGETLRRMSKLWMLLWLVSFDKPTIAVTMDTFGQQEKNKSP
jgi:hypothetical protein